MILVDSHVHIHGCFKLDVFFDCALANFKAEATRWGRGENFTAMLLLTEGEGQNRFQRLLGFVDDRKKSGDRVLRDWTFSCTEESCSLYARSVTGEGLYVIAGRQIVTAENLEVLALATVEVFDDGSPILEAIRTVKKRGGIPVVPWGAGKWTGKRGAILKAVITANNDHSFFLGDNGGRPAMWPPPRLFRIAEEKGIRVVQGSDPLPFRSESGRAGSFGFIVPGAIPPEHPADDLKRLLLDPMTCFRAFGHLEKPHRFVFNQLAMQIIKRRKKAEN